MEAANRRMIRSAINPAKEPAGTHRPTVKKTVPPDQTNAENFYYIKQMQSKTLMVIVLKDNEVVRGVIEWYDKSCLKVNRENEPNVLVYKHNIKYMYKAD